MIVKKKVKVRWNGGTRRHYEELGYQYTKKDNDFWVWADELSKGSNVIIDFICDYCGKEGRKRADSLLKAREVINKDCCKECATVKHNESLLLTKGSLAERHPNIMDEWDYERNTIDPNYTTASSGKKAHWKCKRGHRWISKVYSRSMGGVGCPACSESKGEKEVAKSLDFLQVPYEREYRFDDLRGIGNGILRFDFAVKDENGRVALLIEYDGPFHYRKCFDGDGYETLKNHDRKKDSYCESNNIRLLRIGYFDFDKVFEIVKEAVGSISSISKVSN